ncbi:19353_t:CDS:2 [Rhizophagus irregularis]|nr:19353_t:CDS:2 [Rhizophagus irregularis]
MSSSNSNLWTSMIDEGISVIKETYKMSTITISGMLIRLWCLIRGNSSAFKVAIGNKNDIDDLKEVIPTHSMEKASKETLLEYYALPLSPQFPSCHPSPSRS